MKRTSELEFAVLNDKLENERSMIKHALPKQSVRRPRNDGTASFLKPKVKRMKRRFAMYLESNALVANHSPLLPSSP